MDSRPILWLLTSFSECSSNANFAAYGGMPLITITNFNQFLCSSNRLQLNMNEIEL